MIFNVGEQSLFYALIRNLFMLWAIETFIRSNIQTRKVFRFIDNLFEDELESLGSIQIGADGVAIDEQLLAIFRICSVYGSIEYRDAKKVLVS